MDRTKHLRKVFEDFVLLSSLSLQNVFLKSQDIEDRYHAVLSRYSKDSVGKFSELLAVVTCALETPQDFLGAVYMDSDFGSSELGQFFKYYEVCKLMAKLVCPIDKAKFSSKGYITFHEPASGSGATIIAFVDQMLEIDTNPQTQLWVSAWDIEETAARMCFIQLSLMGIPADPTQARKLGHC